MATATTDETHQEKAFEIRELRKEFPVANGVEVAVDGISIDIDKGNFLTLVGPSGCGKTTTLRCIAGLESPTSGEIIINSRNVTSLPANKRNLAMMFQNIALYPHMSIIDNIAYPLKVDGVAKDQRYEEARRAAEIMQIGDMLGKQPGDLSGGQRQRAALARTIVQDPEAFLMDEPLSDLDAKLKTEIRKEIQEVHKRVGKITIYVTHDQEEAMTMSDRIAVMNDGGVEQIGTPDQIYQYPENKFVAEFIGNPTMNFFNANVEYINGDAVGFSVADSTIEAELDSAGSLTQNDSVIIGVRPVHITMTDDNGDFDAEIRLLERTGEDFLATLDSSEGEIRATVPAIHSISEGDKIGIKINRERIHVFDSETGDTIGHSINSPPEIEQG